MTKETETAAAVLKAFFAEARAALLRGESVTIPGIGLLEVMETPNLNASKKHIRDVFCITNRRLWEEMNAEKANLEPR